MGDRPRSWDVERPTAPPDHSDLHVGLDPRAPHRRHDRVAVHERRTVGPRRLRGRLIERLGTVGVVHPDGRVTVIVDADAHGPRTMRTVPAGEVHPRPGR